MNLDLKHPSREVGTEGKGPCVVISEPPVTKVESAIYWVPWPRIEYSVTNTLNISECPKIGIGEYYTNRSSQPDWVRLEEKQLRKNSNRWRRRKQKEGVWVIAIDAPSLCSSFSWATECLICRWVFLLSEAGMDISDIWIMPFTLSPKLLGLLQ